MQFKPYKILIILIVSFVLSEALLRLFGYKPGYWGKFEGFYPVDSLIIYKNFITDDYGIYKFSPWVTDSLENEKHFNWRTSLLESDAARSALIITDNISNIHSSFKKLEQHGRKDYTFMTKVLYKILEDENWNSEFTKHYAQILQEANPTKLEQAIKSYISKPFNEEGFRGIEFKVHDTTNTRILLIGDSFVYGMSSRPLFNSYSDILLARGYEIYNTGIPGVDPAQYVAIARKYIPLLKPDIVILNYCDGEDLMKFPRVAEKGKPHEHATNAGFYNSYPLGEYLSPTAAYTYYTSMITIPDTDKNLVNRYCSKLCISSLIWGNLLKRDFFEHTQLNAYYNFKIVDYDEAMALTKSYLDTIKSICQKYDVELYNIVVPDKSADQNQETHFININKHAINQLFLDTYYNPQDIFTQADFYKNEDHFNNAGALKFANYIENVIKK